MVVDAFANDEDDENVSYIVDCIREKHADPLKRNRMIEIIITRYDFCGGFLFRCRGLNANLKLGELSDMLLEGEKKCTGE